MPHPLPAQESVPSSELPAGSVRSWLQGLYLGLALAGGIWPWLANLNFIHSHGTSFDLGLFVQLANANPAAQSLSRDLAIGATAVVIWIVNESRRLRMRGLPWVLLSCVTVAFAFGAPLFLYLRERRLAELSSEVGGIHSGAD
ncbi:MAG: DUF2834 domain-containing protein [Cyanobacteriota bacterium]|nr:DUF2834 domain-containing protein [Cyanobacteriota bacterium]